MIMLMAASSRRSVIVNAVFVSSGVALGGGGEVDLAV